MSSVRTGLMLLAAAGVAGCAVGPNYHTPRTPTPDHYDAAVTMGSVAAMSGPATPATAASPAAPLDMAAWWHALEDPRARLPGERAPSSAIPIF